MKEVKRYVAEQSDLLDANSLASALDPYSNPVLVVPATDYDALLARCDGVVGAVEAVARYGLACLDMALLLTNRLAIRRSLLDEDLNETALVETAREALREE